MIKIVVGDLLSANEDLIIHQCNAKGKFGSGIALQMKQKYPEVHEAYLEHCKSTFPNDVNTLLGTVNVCRTHDGKHVANLIAQLDYGYDGKRYTSYDALYDGLSHIKEVCKENNMSVALPQKLGSDRGGASWNVVYAMIEEIFKDYEVTIYQLEEK